MLHLYGKMESRHWILLPTARQGIPQPPRLVLLAGGAEAGGEAKSAKIPHHTHAHPPVFPTAFVPQVHSSKAKIGWFGSSSEIEHTLARIRDGRSYVSCREEICAPQSDPEGTCPTQKRCIPYSDNRPPTLRFSHLPSSSNTPAPRFPMPKVPTRSPMPPGSQGFEG
ncbi:hypothetical protein GQ53DRAFT_463553 [Thozetella sp. PMI_491]|nr:hypothetical protein GQ53DRAFT_463553 [Thozetella sp. PMI_491]